MINWITRLTGLALLCLSGAALAQIPAGYPANYAAMVAAAKKEGKLVIYASTDTTAANPLIKDFEALYPGIKVEYDDMTTTELYNRLIAERAAAGASADVLWSSAMDLQVKLVADGYALTYLSSEAAKLPEWAVWQAQAYGTTYEPVVIVYNKWLVGDDEIPQSHADMVRLLSERADKLKGKITSYDIEKSGVGFLLITQDAKNNAKFWDFARALGAVGTRFQSSSGAMMERISSGESLMGYNIFGSYARLRANKDRSIGIVYPNDYTLVMSRIMFIAKTAAHPNAAKLWLDYILSKRGQTIVASRSDLGSIRADVEGELTLVGLTKTLGKSLKPIPVGPSLLAYLDQAKRLEFLKQWQQAIKGAK